MGEDGETRKFYIIVDGKMVEVPQVFEDSTLADGELDTIRLQEQVDRLTKELRHREEYICRLKEMSQQNNDDMKCALRWLHWYMSRPPRWRVFAYLNWSFSNPSHMEELYFHAGYYKESIECSDKRLRDIFRKYGYSEKLLRK